ncbi:hypothetical protein [Leisingera aquimarina]|uniref:hypothetical protein n=1 Tax=Leisingera aquimarina TaxID=476529 RepID=UPI000422566B|nr:hypothetical protein [Leisingera aquimarina]
MMIQRPIYESEKEGCPGGTQPAAVPDIPSNFPQKLNGTEMTGDVYLVEIQ